MTDSKDEFGDRMKMLEQMEAGRRLLPTLPVCVRLDGKGFSKFTAGLARPYDLGMSKAMMLTTKFLVEETNARVGYTQSDEISLILYSDTYDSQIFFDGKIQKLVSVMASMATAKFNSLIPQYLPSKVGKLAVFDCRVWNVPTREEGANAILWREHDATKNSVSMAARTVYSHKEVDGKSKAEVMDMLMAKGINWNDYPAFFKRGSYFRRHEAEVELTEEERMRIPEKHRPAVGVKVKRTKVSSIYLPPLSKITNRVEVLFDGAEPEDEMDRIKKLIDPMAGIPG
jgi:tRNA(His) 5'-end guanylyltransferase